MTPASHDPYAPANKRPRREGLDRPAAPEHEAHSCAVCHELAAAGIEPPAVEHAPEQHIGDVTYGDVVLSIAPPPLALSHLPDVIDYTAEAWAAVIPEQVKVLHVAERRRYLPHNVSEPLHLAGATLAELDRLETAWQDEDERAFLTDAMTVEPDRRDWADFLAAFRIVIADEDATGGTGDVADATGPVLATLEVLDQLGMDREHAVARWYGYMTADADAWPPEAIEEAVGQLVDVGAWLGDQDDPGAAYAAMDALVGGTGPHKVAEFDAATHHGLTFEEAMEAVWPTGEPPSGFVDAVKAPNASDGVADLVADRIELGPVPEGHVRVSFTRDDLDADPSGEPMGYGMTGDVPTDAKAAVALILDGTDAEDGGDASPEYRADMARLVLAAELGRPPSGRRKSVLDAVAAHLSLAEVEERTRQVDAPETFTGPGPGDGDGTLALDGDGGDGS